MNESVQRSAFKQSGLTLIEVMISVTLGIILLGGTLQLLITSKNGYRLQDGIGSMQENGRYAIYSLRENILVAGYPGFDNIEPFIPDTPLIPDIPLTFDGEESDQIAIKYKSLADCFGKTPASNKTVVNVLSVNLGRSTLDCTAMVMDDDTKVLKKGETLALVDNIESMQILYGVDENEDSVANRYVDATQVDAGIINLGISDWNNVVSVRIALLARSRESIGSHYEQEYQLLDAETLTYNDAFSRQIFTTTIPLRNRIL